MFSETGPSEDDVNEPLLPGFIEVTPGDYRPLDVCTRDEIETHILSLTMQAQALIEEAKLLELYLETGSQ